MTPTKAQIELALWYSGVSHDILEKATNEAWKWIEPVIERNERLEKVVLEWEEYYNTTKDLHFNND